MGNMGDYINIYEDETGIILEIPLERDGSLLQSTLSSRIPGALTLRYKVHESDLWNGIVSDEEYLFPPDGGWGSRTYFCVYDYDVVSKKFMNSINIPLRGYGVCEKDGSHNPASGYCPPQSNTQYVFPDDKPLNGNTRNENTAGNGIHPERAVRQE
ncbi:unnamed protein product [Darwinula stevensoni]|uniref:TAR DNA-binding protein 43 N-terminal domain-containing protein n=1 Tax=Darwinula stevensoni TaxID=69355 RepID=A0A7R9AAZ1_9CRUS|nr:unnamed protein product [Darwinula stevensoni]CAG0898884.1 unnamed protein product [Darwinula stevensoni]